MSAMYNIINNVISGGRYVADELIEKIDTFWVQGILSTEERETLTQKAYDNARDINQIDIMKKISELELRIYALEHPQDEQDESIIEYPIWENGTITEKGQIVRFDYNGDGVYDLLRYDGGRATTSLSPGKIDGWHVVDANGNILGTFYKGEFTPVNPEPEQTEPEGE